ncbi:DNA topoisomerase 1 [Dimargaris verticillata]|uniref:DNA topoisomerase I n=1 Tax=Dimargaris verticillata TaxID=2761393 RepID=A0A9W8EB19_9FUNG|nr:DNA topoisomerase 1 [Dimargaris verticillata]
MKPAAKPKPSLAARAPPAKPAATKPKAANGKATKTPGKAQAKPKAPAKKETPASGKAKKEEEDEDEYKWWLEQNQDTSVKWNTLEHNGVYFPPPYVPHRIPLIYNSERIQLEPEAEEIASYFAQILETDYAKNPVFCRNFFTDFQRILANCQRSHPIKDFDKCNFTLMFEHFQREKERKKAMSKDEKLKLKTEKDKIREKYGTAYVNGRKEKVGNYNIEPPGLFRGRGEHPKTGLYKRRIWPEDITINIGTGAKVPEPPAGHRWGKVVNDNTVTWLAMWRENINNSFKYVFLAAGSSLKGQSDLRKFEKARELKGHVATIRRNYMADLRDKSMATRQRATAMYLIDHLALRAGNEKGDDEADTVGCCSLKYEHVTLESPNILHFDFLGKDSVRYQNAVPVHEQVFKNIKIFKRDPKTDGDELFDRLNTALLNKHLSSLMPGLTAKVFRTYNASHTFQEQLRNTPANGTVQEKLLAYNRANRRVAELCNHQRNVSKGHTVQMEKLRDKIRALKYQLHRHAQQLAILDPKQKRKRSALFAADEELTSEWILSHELEVTTKEKERIEAKFEKDNEDRKKNKEKRLTKADLKDKLDPVVQKLKILQKGKVPTVKTHPPIKRGATVERVLAAIVKLEDRIKNANMSLEDKDENKDIALGTSKINYLDPRITISWCKKYDVPIERNFTKTLREKFKWAMDVDPDWEF